MPLDNKTDTSTIQSDNPPTWHLWHYTTISPLCGKKVLASMSGGVQRAIYAGKPQIDGTCELRIYWHICILR
jgi:hypothetical protein